MSQAISKPFCPQLSPEDVEAWLIQHPNFFYHRPLALIAVNLPTDQQKNVKSLHQYQTQVLREQLQGNKNQLDDLFQHALSNEHLLNLTLSFATQALRIKASQQHMSRKITQLLSHVFNIPQVTIWVNTKPKFKPSSHGNVLNKRSSQWLSRLTRPWAGEKQELPEDAQILINPDSGSIAIIPLYQKEYQIVGCLTLQDPSNARFQSQAEDTFLKHLGQLITALLLKTRSSAV
jgi:uncharacterized protein YigA (DUF484 family)